MRIHCAGVALIRHHTTGSTYEVHADELDWQTVGASEEPMGTSVQYQAEIEHPKLGRLSWEIWEYPVGAEDSSSFNANGHEVIRNLEFGLVHEPDSEDPDDWMNASIPDEPHSIFVESIEQATTLMRLSGSKDGRGLINRMVFSHYITAMESYLCDTLLDAVSTDEEARERLLSDFKGLREQKFSLIEISKNPDIVTHELQKSLRSILYHNIIVVADLFKTALEIDIYPLIKDRDFLFKAVLLRHDCVHRNGKDKDGNELDVFTPDFVIRTGSEIKEFVTSINLALLDKKYPFPSDFDFSILRERPSS